jgi:hypothetical protein
MDSPGGDGPNLACRASGQCDQGTIGAHTQQVHRSRCHVCGQTLTASKGTA